MKQALPLWLFFIGVLALLTGCGGGGSNNSSAPEPTPTVAPPPAQEPVGLWTQGGDNQGLEAYRQRGPALGWSLVKSGGSFTAGQLAVAGFHKV